jgi:hypothetical protein
VRAQAANFLSDQLPQNLFGDKRRPSGDIGRCP